jgi:hypothetical protein
MQQHLVQGAELSPDEREELNKLLLRNIDRFAINPKSPTTTSRTKHFIDLSAS